VLQLVRLVLVILWFVETEKKKVRKRSKDTEERQ